MMVACSKELEEASAESQARAEGRGRQVGDLQRGSGSSGHRELRACRRFSRPEPFTEEAGRLWWER